MTAALDTVFRTFSRHRSLAKILLVSGVGLGKAFDERLMSIHTRFADAIKSHLDEAVAEGSIPPMDTELTAYVWMGAVNEGYSAVALHGEAGTSGGGFGQPATASPAEHLRRDEG